MFVRRCNGIKAACHVCLLWTDPVFQFHLSCSILSPSCSGWPQLHGSTLKSRGTVCFFLIYYYLYIPVFPGLWTYPWRHRKWGVFRITRTIPPDLWWYSLGGILIARVCVCLYLHMRVIMCAHVCAHVCMVWLAALLDIGIDPCVAGLHMAEVLLKGVGVQGVYSIRDTRQKGFFFLFLSLSVPLLTSTLTGSCTFRRWCYEAFRW